MQAEVEKLKEKLTVQAAERESDKEKFSSCNINWRVQVARLEKN